VSQAEQGARAFGPYADTYHLARPGYPAAAVDWALDGNPGTVLDLGAGTGILTAALAARGLRTIAVDPSPAMLRTLARGLPGVPVLTGTAEAIPLADATVDAVVVGAAFHWFARPGMVSR